MLNLVNLYKKIPCKAKTIGVIALVFILLVFLVLPKWTINNSQPFSDNTVKIILLAIVALMLSLKNIIQFIAQNKSKTLSVISIKITGAYAKTKIIFLDIFRNGKFQFFQIKDKIKKDYHKRQAQKLPWYLVLGTPQSGKKSIINNTSLQFVKPEYFSEDAVHYIHQAPEMDWHFSPKAIFVDALKNQSDQDNLSWKKFIKLLKRNRKNKPINGIVLSLSITDLMQYTNKQRQEFSQVISQYIRDLYENFRSITPVYLILNKCDLIDGFMEFFNDLSREEINQIWGITLPTDQCNNSSFTQQYINNEFRRLIVQLNKRIMWAMANQHNQRGRELINTFPQQIQLFQKPLVNFISELFDAVKFPKAMQFRGVYLTSCNQSSGQAVDFMMHAMSKKFQFVPTNTQKQRRIGESYFIREVFYRVMDPESRSLGDSEKAIRRKNYSYKAVLLLLPSLLITSIFGMHNGFKENSHRLNLVDNQISEYQSLINTENTNSDSLISLLPALNMLNQSHDLYTDNTNWGMHFLFITRMIRNNINSALQRSLHSYFLPRVASQIETNLNQNISDQNLLYAMLKGYLAFSHYANTSQETIKAPMKYEWDRSLKKQPHTANQLNYYLDYSLETDVEKLPLDQVLINRVRNKLEEVIPSERAYGLLSLKGSIGNVPDLKLNYALGNNFKEIFKEKNNQYAVSGLYTREGFNKIYLEQYEEISKEVAADNKDIGLETSNHRAQSSREINHIVQKTYQAHYLEQWQQALDNISIKPFTSIDQAISSLELLTSKESPLPKLLDIVYDNTSEISHDKVQIASKFSKLNSFSHEASSSSWLKTVDELNNIREYLVKIQQSANQDNAALLAAKDAMDGKENPIQILSREALKAPQPLQRWLLAIADNCWNVVIIGAHNELNANWRNTVINQYNANIKGRYPLVNKFKSQIDIASFDAFFGPDGVLDNYFNLYLKPFINTNNKKWSAYEVNGHSIKIDQKTIDIFQKAQAIKKDFFPQDAKHASFNFSIKPQTLTSKASSIQFILGNQHITYSHGPQETEQVTWPLPFNAESSNILITNFEGNQLAKANSGPWSLFQIFDYGEFKPLKNQGAYRFNLNLNSYTASFLITGTANMNVFKLKSLKGFSLPQTLAPNK